MFQAVIFDLDGLLIDSEPLWRDTEVKVFGALGLPITHQDCEQTIGLRVDEFVRYWYDRFPWKGKSLQVVEQEIVEEMIFCIRQRGVPKAGVEKIFNFFAEKQLPMAVASSSYVRIIEAALQTLGLLPHITLFHSAEHETFGKPHPAVYLTTARKLNVDPVRCLAFEDSPMGVQSAKSAGLTCVCIPDSIVDQTKLSQADLLLESLEVFDDEHLTALARAEEVGLKKPGL
ncbi:MAG TPA: hexitol phosphatase HxpB, partial [Acidobacteriota bacterium]|nr:hexitol phosphatase HxpB [Acidobacteriota bacterium]